MSASGILNADYVIFYHPLDDFREHTQDQVWLGSGAFVTGKIGDANSGAAYAGPTFGTPIDLTAATASNGGFNYSNAIAPIDDSSAFVFYINTSTGDNAYDPVVHVASVSGSSVSVGSGYKLGNGHESVNRQLCGCYMGNNKFVAAWYTSSSTYEIIAGSGSGQSISLGTAVAFTGGGEFHMSYMSDDKAIVTYYRNVGGEFKLRGRVVSLDGLTVSVGTEATLSPYLQSYYSDIARIDDTRAIVVVYEDINSTISATIVTVDDTTLSSGVTAYLAESGCNSMVEISMVSDDTAVASYYWYPTMPERGIYCQAVGISGTTITPGTRVRYDDDFTTTTAVDSLAVNRLTDESFLLHFTNSATYTCCKRLSADRFLMADKLDTSSERYALLCTLDGLDITYESQTNTTYTGNLIVGQVEYESSGVASTPSAYPSTSGNDRLVMALWCKNLTPESSTTTISRDYEIQFTSDSIGLGPSGAVWSGSLITSLLNDISDGDSHLLVLDFEHSSSGNWLLSVSVDGSGFTDYGQQNSGTRDIFPETLSPSFQILDGDYGQWIDELVLWGGDKNSLAKFNETYLQNLFVLADTYNAPMNEYYDNFVSSINNSADLFTLSVGDIISNISGFICGKSSDNDSVDCYLCGCESFSASASGYIYGKDIESSSCNLFLEAALPSTIRPIDWFFYSADYYPQLLGVFVGTIASVIIRVWDITDGQNTEEILGDNNICYRIGDTARWAWSTANLRLNTNMPKQFFYLMIADNNETFSGQFIMDIPEEARWIHPSNMGDYIK